MFQKGPGEGYHAAKQCALAIEPTAKCERREFGSLKGFIVSAHGKAIGSGSIARDAWNDALHYLKRRPSHE